MASFSSRERRDLPIKREAGVSFLLFQSGSFGIWPGNYPDSSPYEWTFGTFRHKPLGKIVYTFSGSDPVPGQTMKGPRARTPPRKLSMSKIPPRQQFYEEERHNCGRGEWMKVS